MDCLKGRNKSYVKSIKTDKVGTIKYNDYGILVQVKQIISFDNKIRTDEKEGKP